MVERGRQRQTVSKNEQEQARERAGSLDLRAFVCSVKTGILVKVPGEDLTGMVISFFMCVCSRLWSLLISLHRGG